METIKLYYHKTDGGAEYLCSKNVEGTDEGSFNSQYIVRIDGDVRHDAELLIKKVKGTMYEALKAAQEGTGDWRAVVDLALAQAEGKL